MTRVETWFIEPGASPRTSILNAACELLGDALKVPRSPAVNITPEKRGIEQTIIIAVIMPTPVISNKNHCWRQRQAARVAIEPKKDKPRCPRRGVGRAISLLLLSVFSCQVFWGREEVGASGKNPYILFIQYA